MKGFVSRREIKLLSGILVFLIIIFFFSKLIYAQTYTVNGVIYDWNPGRDDDSDTYYETFSFFIAVDATISSGSEAVYIKTICNTTGQEWWSNSPIIITETPQYHSTVFSEDKFAENLRKNQELDFSVELWNEAKTVKLESDASVSGEPIKTDIPPSVTVYGRIEYQNGSNTSKPVRFAKVEVIETNATDPVIYNTTTNALGVYSIVINNDNDSDNDNTGADITVKVYTQGDSRAYLSTLSGLIGSIKDPASGLPLYFKDFVGPSDNYKPDVEIPLLIEGSDSANLKLRGAFSVYDSIVEAFIKTYEIYHQEMNSVEVHWPDNRTSTSETEYLIHLLLLDRWDRDVILHEYGHIIKLKGGFQNGDVGGSYRHLWNVDLRYWPVIRDAEKARNLAFIEAWATFFAVSVQCNPNDPTPDTSYDDTEDNNASHNLEADTGLPISSPNGQYFECKNACTLWDIFDAANDYNDNLTIGHDDIWTVVSQDKPNEITGFWNSWFTRHSPDSAAAIKITDVFLDHKMSFIAQRPWLISPIPGSHIASTPVTLAWDYAPNASNYDVYLGTDETFNTTEIINNTTSNSYLWTPPISDRITYYWQIVAKDGKAEAKSAIWNFQMDTTPPPLEYVSYRVRSDKYLEVVVRLPISCTDEVISTLALTVDNLSTIANYDSAWSENGYDYYKIKYDVSGFTTNPHTFKASISDVTGNQTTLAYVAFVIEEETLPTSITIDNNMYYHVATAAMDNSVLHNLSLMFNKTDAEIKAELKNGIAAAEYQDLWDKGVYNNTSTAAASRNLYLLPREDRRIS